MRAHLHREAFVEALQLAEQRAREAPHDRDRVIDVAAILGEMGRRSDAGACSPSRSAPLEAELELAWLDRLEGDLESCQRRLEAALPRAGPHSRIRVFVQLGRAAAQRGDPAEPRAATSRRSTWPATSTSATSC